MKVMKFLALTLLMTAIPCFAQTTATPTTPTPTTASMNFNIGAGALGLGGSNQATAATDVALTINPGIAKLPGLSLRSDNLLAPGANLQFYAGGFEYQLPKLAKSGLLSAVYFDLNATAGINRITSATLPTKSSFGLMAGASMHYLTSANVDLNLFQVGFLRTPGAPWGANAPYFGGSVSYFFGKQ